MDALEQWAQRWDISHEAIADLPRVLVANAGRQAPTNVAARDERGVQDRIRVAASQENWRLFRNNVGAVRTDDGRFLRFGLANDSTRMNEAFKSSDLIGIRPLEIDPTYIGRTVGQFVAIECKRPGWKPGASKREQAQRNFLTLIESLGGHARFSTGGLE